MADTIKCPNCSANLVFDPGSQKLTCGFCGASFDPSIFESKIDELETSAEVSEATDTPDAAAAQETTTAAPADVQPEQTHQEEVVTEVSETLGPSEQSEGAAQTGAPGHKLGEQMEFVCNACGAKVVTDLNTAATFCTFCGSPAMVGQRLNNEFRPQYMIPFKIPRQQAEQAFIKWAGHGKWTPLGFASAKNIAKITGLYVPFWLFDIKAHIDCEGTAQDISYTGNYRIAMHYNFARNGDVAWSNIPLDGETRIDDKLMEAIEPFDFKGLIPFDYNYLPGFYADRYDQDAQSLAERATNRAVAGMDEAIKLSIKKDYDTYKISKNRSAITSMMANYALLPVWFLSYKYHGKNYYFAMNGQTGEVAGNVPISPVKKLGFFFIVLSIAAVVTRFLLGIFMRGIWG